MMTLNDPKSATHSRSLALLEPRVGVGRLMSHSVGDSSASVFL